MPDITLPEIRLPDVKLRDGRMRDVRLPDIDLRDRLPDVDLSRIPVPSGLRELSLPEVNLRDVALPDIRLDLSGIDTARLRELAPFVKPAPKRRSRLPWILLAAFGTLFAGWWLASSPQTGPRVRDMASRVRERFADWQARRNGWDDDEMVVDETWSVAMASPGDSSTGATDAWTAPEAVPTQGGATTAGTGEGEFYATSGGGVEEA